MRRRYDYPALAFKIAYCKRKFRSRPEGIEKINFKTIGGKNIGCRFSEEPAVIP